MSAPIRVASWNIEGRLSRFTRAGRRGSPEEIVKAIGRINSDIIIFPEAFDGTKPVETDILNQLDALGYRSIATSYKERSDRQSQAVVSPHMMLLSRLEVARYYEWRLGDIRTIIVADVELPGAGQTIRIFGVHLDDRSEVNRLKQVEDLIRHVAESPFPVIVMGDFNAMHGGGVCAKFLRNKLVRLGINLFPHASTRDILQRLSGMAAGDTMCRLEQATNLRDVDPRRRATTTPKMRGQEWMPSVRMVQIDHILVSPELATGDFAVAPDGGSDHRAISVSIRTT